MRRSPQIRLGSARERGIGFLEAAAFLAVMLVFVIGAVAVVDYIQERRFCVQTVDKHLYESALRPLNFGDRSRIEANRAALGRYLHQVAQGIEQQLLRHGAAAYYIEVLYAGVPIDVHSGASSGARWIGERVERGSRSAASPELLASTSLEERLDLLVRRSAGGELAAPSALGSWASAAAPASAVEPERFLPLAVLVGARAYYRKRGGFGEELRSVAGLEPVFYHLKVVPLRGDVDLE